MAYLAKARETADPIYFAKAEENLKASMAFQRNFEALRALAFLAMEKHEFGAALEYATEAQAADPSDWETRGILSDAYWALGDRSSAVKLVQEMLASGETFAALSRLAVIRFAEGDTAGAIESMRNACIQADKESRPLDNRAWCYTRLGTYLAARGDTAAAEQAYRRAVTYIPGYPYALRELEMVQGGRMPGTERKSAAAKPN
jgi:tetratricopeptide (TPR) repeat protein